jgi:hypothetical protein
MAGINTAGVVKGGLAAGLVMNISETILNVPVAGARMEAELAAHNLPPVTGGAIAAFVLICFAVGILTVWMYAAMRPRLGPGPKTAICAGLFVWAIGYLWCGLVLSLIGVQSWGLAILGIVWGLVEMVVASWVGGYLYSEA